MEQGSREWFEARLGKVTASRISDVMAQGRGGSASVNRANYLAELVCERLTGQIYDDGIKTAYMDRGNEIEAQARAAYSLSIGEPIEQVGFVQHPTIAMAGASPDGLIGMDGGCEFKCRKTAIHLALLQKPHVPASIPGGDLKQVHFNLACTGRQWWDYNTFDPRLPDPMRLITIRVHRDPVAIAEIEAAVRAFSAEVEASVHSLRAKFIPEVAA